MKSVAIVVQDDADPFGLGLLIEVWGEPYHPEDDSPVFDVRVCTPRPGRVRGRSDFDLHVERGLDAAADADLVCLSPKFDFLSCDPAVLDVARAAHARGAMVYAHCTAAFMLAEAGLLDGRACTTHWRYADVLAQMYPRVTVRPDVLYVQDGTILTGAGSAGGIDASLHLVRQQFGAGVAATTARRMVVPPHRDGGQAQFVRTPVQSTEAATLAPVLDWMTAHLGEQLTVDRLAAHAHMSPRTFARRFRDETGTTPLQWLTNQRIALCEELLESTTLSVEQIASRVGFGQAATLRHHFSAVRGTTPLQYRRAFGQVDAS
ncbi:MAG: helix-turn-helix domain-containing protein [Aeromicrobium sp.]